jgi:hypothetical protein
MTVPPGAEDDRDTIVAAVRRLHIELCEAMVAEDVESLEDILAEGFTLTHMTGYLQPRAEWLDDITSRQMQYHSMETVGVDVDFLGGTPILTARTPDRRYDLGC